MHFEKLEQNIIDLVKEEQAKLGYRKECIRLYYPLSSLMHLTGKSCGEQDMLTLLSRSSLCLGSAFVNVCRLLCSFL